MAWMKWRVADDDGGTAIVAIDHGSHIESQKYVFDSLAELPPEIVRRIREDGRSEGEIQDTYA